MQQAALDSSLRSSPLLAGVTCHQESMYSKYFEDCEIRPEYKKEFVSLWSGWLGKESLHKLDEVTQEDWKRFNDWIQLLVNEYKLLVVDRNSESTSEVKNVDAIISTYEESMDKGSSQFSHFIIPELECVITEDWDYTYIIWYKDSSVIKTLSTLINKAGLEHFHG